MKGQISLIEMITSAIILFITLTILFPSISYQDRWSEALILLKGRDLVLTIDRIEKLYKFSFDSESLKNFLNRTLNETNLIYWSETEGTLKHVINVVCNCTQEQINNLSLWFGEIKINNRTINLRFLGTYLHNLSEYAERSDVLLIWGYKNLTPYSQSLRDYLAKENGIVEIMDFADIPNIPESVQAEIFGITSGGTWASVDYDVIIKPNTTRNITYQAYKNFYHVPFPLRAIENTTSIPVEGIPTPNCPKNVTGNFTLNSSDVSRVYKFWICNSTHTYFDTNANNNADIIVKVGENFALGSSNFFLNYIDNYTRIGVSFRPDYRFSDFCKASPSKRVIPVNSERYRVFMLGVRSGAAEPPYCVVLNATGKTAWLADFSRGGLANVKDDHKNLLLSLLLSTSNKKAIGVLAPGIKIGYGTSYLNSVNEDMFEIYTFKLGLGYPY